MFHNYNQSEYYLARIDALLNHIDKLETCIEIQTGQKLKIRYGKKHPKRNI
jgi:hypothetical protein|tara:strand:- start:1142 stop:1294 length:153 start_codon:yes stop_codon:yes gene_type:complete